MKTRLRSRVAVGAISFVVAGLAFSGAAEAVTDTVFKYSSPKNGFYTISHMAMTPADHTAANDYNINTGPGGLNTNQNGCFVGGVNLPNGAMITGVSVWYKSGVPGNPEFQLISHHLIDATSFLVASRTVFDNSGVRKGTNLTLPAQHKIDNARRSYGFQACIWPDDAFYGARISYTYDNAGD